MRLPDFLTRERHLSDLRQPIQRAAQYIQRRHDAALADVRSIGRDTVKTGIAAMVVNAWLTNRALFYAGLTALALGLIMWLVGLPTDESDDDDAS